MWALQAYKPISAHEDLQFLPWGLVGGRGEWGRVLWFLWWRQSCGLGGERGPALETRSDPGQEEEADSVWKAD